MNSGDVDRAEGRSRRGLTPRRRPRKFVIESTFGSPRQPRSRKNRPCDACRRRKTACIITSDPPCEFCKEKGIPCVSAPPDGPIQKSRPPSSGRNDAPGTRRKERRQKPQQAQITDNENAPNTSVSATSHGVQLNVDQHEELQLDNVTQTFIDLHHDGDPAALIHRNLVHHSSPSALDVELSKANEHGPVASGSFSYTLEDVPGRCAYYMGPTCEQDGFLLDAFKYGILSERFNLDANISQVYSGNTSSPNDTPVHFLLLQIGHPDHVNQDRQHASDTLESRIWPHGDDLVRLFFRHVHPVFPVVSKARFLNRYQSNKRDIPACLRGAVYALACVFWSSHGSLKNIRMPFKQHELVNYAQTALRREVENPNLFVVQACLLLQHTQPPSIDAIEAPTTWTSAAQATAAAQMIGLHLEPTRWKINQTEKHLRRKLWWAIFYADCWSSVCHGNPPHIANTSYTTEPLTMEDVRCDEEVSADLHHLVDHCSTSFQIATGARFIQMVDIARSLRLVLDSGYQANANVPDIVGDVQAKASLVTTQSKLSHWTSLLPTCLAISKGGKSLSGDLTSNCPLHLSYYAAQVLLYRALMHPPTRQAKFQPGSNLRTWFPEALNAFESCVEFLSCVNKCHILEFWGRHARSQLVLCGNFLVFLFLLASDRQDIERAYRLLESFHQTMHGLWDPDVDQVTTLLRVAKLRIDSFFAQAAEVIRRGNEGNPFTG